MPWLLFGTFTSTAWLAPGSAFSRQMLGLQLTGYAVVAAAHFLPALRQAGPVRMAYWFVQVNLSFADAGFRFRRGQRVRTWNPAVR